MDNKNQKELFKALQQLKTKPGINFDIMDLYKKLIDQIS